MGAHVWAPAYLRDHLLPSFRLTGWTPDWYAGFPAFQFYMVLPSLAIALLSLRHPLRRRLQAGRHQRGAEPARRLLGVRRLTRLPFPAPPLLAVAATAFLFDRSFSIYGGNIASTLAGEFAFSISLTLRRALPRRRRPRASRPAGTGPGPPCCWPSPACATSSPSSSPSPARWSGCWCRSSGGPRRCRSSPARRRRPRAAGRPRRVANAVGGVFATVVAGRLVVRPGSAPGSGGWWRRCRRRGPHRLVDRAVLPALGLHERHGVGEEDHLHRPALPAPEPRRPALQLARRSSGSWCWPCSAWSCRSPGSAGPGALPGWSWRSSSAVGFRYMPQGRLWNARLLPFWYLCLYLLAAVGVAELGRTAGRAGAPRPRPPRRGRHRGHRGGRRARRDRRPGHAAAGHADSSASAR